MKRPHRPFLKPLLRLQIRFRLAWPHSCFDNCTSFAYVLRASDERTEPEAKSKAEDSNRALVLSRLSQILTIIGAGVVDKSCWIGSIYP